MRVVALIISVVLGLSEVCYSAPDMRAKQPFAVNGVLDLTQWDFDRDGAVSLDGEWDFYWQQLLVPDDFERLMPPSKSGVRASSLILMRLAGCKSLSGKV